MNRKMCFGRRRWRPSGLILLGALALASGAYAEPAVNAVRIGDHPDKSRFVLDLSGPVTYSVFALADPYRIVIDLPEVEWRLDPRAVAKSRVITGYRFGLFKPGTARMVLDIAKPVLVTKSFLLPPEAGRSHRLVLDLTPTTRDVFLRTVSIPPSAEAPPVPQAPPRPPAGPSDRRRMIAIDPGHGGVDPGAIAASGFEEKTITLAMAQELRRQLLATQRYRVVLTRDRDVFVRLRDRIAIAQKAGAELFVSLHADSIASSKVRGGSVYTLSENASDAEAAALAAKENRADMIAGLDLSDQSETVAKILIDLRQRLTKNASVVFAREVLDELGKTSHLLRRNHRFAGFAVLKAPEIPSILIEMGYLSNPIDERLLRQTRHRQQIAAALVRATDAFFREAQAQSRP